MKILYTKDKNRRNFFLFLEKKKIILNHIINNLKLSNRIKMLKRKKFKSIL